MEDAEARGEHEHTDQYEGAGEYDEYLFELALNGLSLQELVTGHKPDTTNTGCAMQKLSVIKLLECNYFI